MLSGCSGQTPGSLDFPVKEAHGDFQSRGDFSEAGQQPPVGLCESEAAWAFGTCPPLRRN